MRCTWKFYVLNPIWIVGLYFSYRVHNRYMRLPLVWRYDNDRVVRFWKHLSTFAQPQASSWPRYTMHKCIGALSFA